MRKSGLASRIGTAGVGVALAAAATVAFSGTAHAEDVYGRSTNLCADASGTYNYVWTGNAQGRDTYSAYFNITVRDKCTGDGWAGGLYLSYWKYQNGQWKWFSHQRVKVNGTYTTPLHNVDGVQINVCNYYPERAPAGCSRVW
ncbi:hypothetical protein ACFYOV_29990 [Streptomyces sp. NPDC005931]|uniref:hypothetical protein n=1 Tax=Streptomyces sp. NPDC005931 TaxID=3364737 RepID=UPI0036B75314